MQLKGFFASWTEAACSFKECFLCKVALQMSQLNGLFPSWTESRYVYFQIEFSCEVGNANVTFKWVISIMHFGKMRVQRSFISKVGRTNVAFVWSLSNSWTEAICTYHQKITFVNKSSTTKDTMKILLSFMNWGWLSLQRAVSSKSGTTYIAYEWFLSIALCGTSVLLTDQKRTPQILRAKTLRVLRQT